jgi:hypothetical protein
LLNAVQESGLLEQTVLLFGVPDAAGRRDVLASTGERVGFACRQRTVRWWWRWLRRVMAVHEQLDEPLVFTVRRCFTLAPAFHVYDADDELVGTVALPWLLDRWGRPSVEMTTLPGGGGVFRTDRGDMLAEWKPDGMVVRLELHEPISGDPFLKMLLVAAMLSKEWDG